MKDFEYSWDDDIFLLHIQLNNKGQSEYKICIKRKYEGGKSKKELMKVTKNESFRFIISRTHPKEQKFLLEFPKSITIEVYKIDDRAYYPTEAFYVG